MDLLRSIFKGDKVIWIIFLFLCLISIIEVFSAASTLTYKSGDHWEPITQHSILLMVGVVIVVLVHNIPYKWFQVFPVFLLPLSICLLAFVMIMGIITGDRINGAARWMTFMGIQFQPSEIAKMAVIIVTAFILSKGQDENGASPKAFKRIMIITCIVCGLILPENYSTGMLLFCTVYLMMFIGRVPARKLLILGGGLLAFAAVFVAFLLATPNETLERIPMGHRLTTVKARITDFTNNNEIPAAKYDIDENAQVAHARIAVATSHIVGKGPGNSVQRDFLSQAFSDFIYAIIVEELGLVGGIIVVFLYICLLVRVGRIARKCNRTFPAFLITGIALLLVTQALFNMMVAVGLAPVTGQPLPLISKGGTSTFINCAYIGMILSVSLYTARLEEQQAHDAQIPMQIETDPGEESSDVQTATEPTAKALNSDAEFE
ncbi:FtsW/RodA/SpoVE family cell cycle protein [Bacteroides sp. UBA939]|uniref:FtsW/RodA/SpoVE family cell cycle protein n=1 Tax=Bacteroides sp. UBA939 TaxID=1946092 RepID=UPI0025C62487|nr:FtsW/RodA/SpoVE family cell cycle protein [Bacteroides sp. UBA939]